MPSGIYQHRKGYKRPPFSKEWKEKLSKSLKDRKLSEEHKRKIGFIRKGRKHSEESKKKIGFANSISLKDRKIPLEIRKKISNSTKGENHHNWQGGKTPEYRKIRMSIEFRLWREVVFARDNWTCQKTGIKGGKLHPHHIQNFAQYPELRFAIDNGITLSKEAHKEFHKKYGLKNNTREQIEEFLIS